jgi:hypothetical protein
MADGCAPLNDKPAPTTPGRKTSMIRRDNSQDAERPRNYSSFWIEVAQGKDSGSSAGAALSDDILDLDVPEDTGDDLAALADLTELAAPVAPVAPAKPAKNKPADKKPEAPRSLSSLADLANIDMLMKNSADLGDETEVDLASDEAQDLDVPLTSDYDFENTSEDEGIEAESLDEIDEADYDDDEEENDDWGGRKTKQSKPLKQRRPERRQY